MILPGQLRLRKEFIVPFTALLVGLHGAFVLSTTLLDQLAAHHGPLLGDFTIDIPLLVGISLVYLSSQLLRRKHTAWAVALVVYIFFLGFNLSPLLVELQSHHMDIDELARTIIVPATIIGLLLLVRREFIVRSDLQAFRYSLTFIIVILFVMLTYGTVGFLLLGKMDFRSEISVAEAVHRTIDQFDLTTNKPLEPHTKRAHVFMDSLSFVSVASLVYIAISLFQPLRARYGDQTTNRHKMLDLLSKHGAPSEEFFKLWPHDKQYFFTPAVTAGLAFRVKRGVAVVLGDPIGEKKGVSDLLQSFGSMCFRNDWLPAIIHAEPRYRQLYESLGYNLQLIGQEAIVDIDTFTSTLYDQKYFRQIRNRFERQNYSCELLSPPHHPALVSRLREISDEWLALPGRTERGFVMGYFSEAYLQQCPVLVARDAAGTIQAFLNQVPADFDNKEATFDMLRQTEAALGNSNDYVLMKFIDIMQKQGYKRVNLGLSPLVGIKKHNENNTMLDTFLRFAYVSGDRFYSFSGLHRFKAKYQPEWRDRYVVYKDGVRGFARTMNVLMNIMQVKSKL